MPKKSGHLNAKSTKNWSSRNEVAKTSGRLHPLGPQNKWLLTPRTTDYRHTRQDRRIQTELAFTLAKNATKPNPFEIAPLQTTRKEYNWKTKEALERAVVTLETERIKGSNRWCLWWWWWWVRFFTSLCFLTSKILQMKNDEECDICCGSRCKSFGFYRKLFWAWQG